MSNEGKEYEEVWCHLLALNLQMRVALRGRMSTPIQTSELDKKLHELEHAEVVSRYLVQILEGGGELPELGSLAHLSKVDEEVMGMEDHPSSWSRDELATYLTNRGFCVKDEEHTSDLYEAVVLDWNELMEEEEPKKIP